MCEHLIKTDELLVCASLQLVCGDVSLLGFICKSLVCGVLYQILVRIRLESKPVYIGMVLPDSVSVVGA